MDSNRQNREDSMSSIKIVKKPFRLGVPDEVLQQLVGLSVSCNDGPNVAYFGFEEPPASWIKYIDARRREDFFYISSRTLARNCAYEERDIAKEWFEKNMPDCWILLPEGVCEFQP
jgi:hypothetical protein